MVSVWFTVMPGAPGHEHIRKPLYQGPMAFPTVIWTGSGTTGTSVCKKGDQNPPKWTRSETKSSSFWSFGYFYLSNKTWK